MTSCISCISWQVLVATNFAVSLCWKASRDPSLRADGWRRQPSAAVGDSRVCGTLRVAHWQLGSSLSCLLNSYFSFYINFVKRSLFATRAYYLLLRSCLDALNSTVWCNFRYY